MSESKAIDFIAMMVIVYAIYVNFWNIVVTILLPLLKLIGIFISPFIIIYLIVKFIKYNAQNKQINR